MLRKKLEFKKVVLVEKNDAEDTIDVEEVEAEENEDKGKRKKVQMMEKSRMRYKEAASSIVSEIPEETKWIRVNGAKTRLFNAFIVAFDKCIDGAKGFHPKNNQITSSAALLCQDETTEVFAEESTFIPA